MHSALCYSYSIIIICCCCVCWDIRGPYRPNYTVFGNYLISFPPGFLINRTQFWGSEPNIRTNLVYCLAQLTSSSRVVHKSLTSTIVGAYYKEHKTINCAKNYFLQGVHRHVWWAENFAGTTQQQYLDGNIYSVGYFWLLKGSDLFPSRKKTNYHVRLTFTYLYCCLPTFPTIIMIQTRAVLAALLRHHARKSRERVHLSVCPFPIISASMV